MSVQSVVEQDKSPRDAGHGSASMDIISALLNYRQRNLALQGRSEDLTTGAGRSDKSGDPREQSVGNIVARLLAFESGILLIEGEMLVSWHFPISPRSWKNQLASGAL